MAEPTDAEVGALAAAAGISLSPAEAEAARANLAKSRAAMDALRAAIDPATEPATTFSAPRSGATGG